MNDLLSIAVLILASAIAIAVMAVVAFRRTSIHRATIDRLSHELHSAVSRLEKLERVAGERTTAPAPAPMTAPQEAVPPVAAPAAPILAAPPVTAPATPVPAIAATAKEVTPMGAATLTRPAPAIDAPVMPMPIEAKTTAPAARHPAIEWLFQGNPIAKLGVVLLFFGLAYLLRFASERGMLPIELRLAGAAAIAIGLLAVGWRLREKSPTYALTLQGGSIGGLYLTSFAAFRVYSLLPHGLVFALLMVICAASVALAVLQRAQSLAVLASLGGFLAPVLLSTGGGSHVALFTYYGVLSAGILAVSIWQAWRPLNLVGFLFTFGVGTLWGADQYEPSLYASCQVFLALNVLIYGVLAVLMALRHGDSREAALVDGTLAFGTPLVGFGLQVGLTQHWTYGPAFSALAFGALYLPLAWFALQRWPDRGRRLVASFLALGAGFVTLAIPLALSARWTSMAWALEGLGVLWIGRDQRQARVAWSGTGLLALAGISGWIAWMNGVDTTTFLMLSATLSLCWLAGGWLWSRADVRSQQHGSPIPAHALLAGGILVWLVMIAGGSDRLVDGESHAALFGLLWMSLSAAAWRAAGARLGWSALAGSAFLLWPVAYVALAVQGYVDGSPFSSGWWSAVWIATVATAWHLLRSARTKTSWNRGLPLLHATFWWFVFALAGIETFERLDRSGWGAQEWPIGGALVVSALFVLGVAALAKRGHWAVVEYPRTYWIGALVPAAYVGAALLVRANLLDGHVPGLTYVPLMNILEEPAAFALLMGGVWYRSARSLLPRGLGDVARTLLLALVIWWVNGALLRALAMVGDVTWSFEALWESTFIQTSMALAWTLGALACMWVAARRSKRTAWLAGAGALAVVVAKLFAVDSARGGGLARAVAFIGVALLILLIGYVAPLPPSESKDEGVTS